MEKEMIHDKLSPHTQVGDSSHEFDRDGEMGLGAVDIQRVEKVYRYWLRSCSSVISSIEF